MKFSTIPRPSNQALTLVNSAIPLLRLAMELETRADVKQALLTHIGVRIGDIATVEQISSMPPFEACESPDCNCHVADNNSLSAMKALVMNTAAGNQTLKSTAKNMA